MADLISSEVAHRRFHPSSLGFHPAKQDFIKYVWLAGMVFVLASPFCFTRKTQIVQFMGYRSIIDSLKELLIFNGLCDIINSPKIKNLIKQNIKGNTGMKKVCFVLVLILTLFMLCSCGGYVKSYSATMLITSYQGNEASMKFDTFKGTYNFKLRRDGIAEHTLDFEASLAEGEMNVYIGVDGEKELLLIVKGGESYDETIILDDKYDNEKSIYIILETIGKCVDGDFEFEYN